MRLQGQYQVKPKLPFIPGSEISGKVIEVGRDVRTVAVGDPVRFLLRCMPEYASREELLPSLQEVPSIHLVCSVTFSLPRVSITHCCPAGLRCDSRRRVCWRSCHQGGWRRQAAKACRPGCRCWPASHFWHCTLGHQRKSPSESRSTSCFSFSPICMPAICMHAYYTNSLHKTLLSRHCCVMYASSICLDGAEAMSLYGAVCNVAIENCKPCNTPQATCLLQILCRQHR